jgi:hypothetical protein
MDDRTNDLYAGDGGDPRLGGVVLVCVLFFIHSTAVFFFSWL